MITKEMYVEVYLSGKYADPHSELAKRLNKTRQEAKQEAFVWLYSPESLSQDYKALPNVDYAELEKRLASWKKK